MTTAPEIQSRKAALCQRLSRLDAEREKLSEKVRELEAAERVLTRFAEPETAHQRPGAGAATAEVARPKRRMPSLIEQLAEVGRGRPAPTEPPDLDSLSEMVLQAVRAYPDADRLSANRVLGYLQREFRVRVNSHVLASALRDQLSAPFLELEPRERAALEDLISELPDRDDASESLEVAATEFKRAADRLLAVADEALAEAREGRTQTRAILDRLEARLASHGQG